ncbi:MAG TPA: SH3 domain-containing protein, partial [Bryobacteraceae bacterium]|nr:SH3 domain-containing protein [Bryobacteraceae bacterium]
MRAVFGCVILAAALLLGGCGSDDERAPSIGDAYIGPATLNLRKEIDTKSPTVAVTHHGDHVEIVGRRRLWYKVRTDKGIEGWTEDRQLLDKAQMLRIRKLAEQTAGPPSQGKATTYDLLNVHSEPSRTSTSFVQVKEKEVFEVIAHRVTARNTKQPKRQLTHPTPKSTAPPKKAKKDAVPPPPGPAAPEPPVDWIALSRERGVDADADTPPVAQDDWSLIRTASGQTGWVLTSRVYMLIPDEVAQYAEGHRIVSYASIGKIDDNGQQKDIWLWTTIESLGQDYDFDSYRVFVWSLRHHRYETAYIQRRERGYLPVLAKEGWFSVCVEDKNGDRIRRDYTMTGNTVRPAGVRACEVKPVSDTEDLDTLPIAVSAPKPATSKSVTE